jgi:uncharacterized protein (DUF433 family)
MKTIQKEIKDCKSNHRAILMLIASKYNDTITREKVKADYPELWFEMLKYNQIDYDLSYINIEILTNEKTIKCHNKYN